MTSWNDNVNDLPGPAADVFEAPPAHLVSYAPQAAAQIPPVPPPVPQPRPASFGMSAARAVGLVALVFSAALCGGVAGSTLTARTMLALMPKPQTVVVAASEPVAQKAESQAAAPAQSTVGSLAGSVYRKVSGSVVEIATNSGTGSGVVVDAGGVIVTNYHVIAPTSTRSRTTQKITVRFSSGDSRTASVLKTDQTNDLALIKVDLPAGVTPVVLADSEAVGIGDTIVAIGNPFGLDGTVTQGIVSAVHRQYGGQGDLIQVDAAINPGNSGGPLLNAEGQVIGITSMIASPVRGSVGIGFAVPINLVKEMLR